MPYDSLILHMKNGAQLSASRLSLPGYNKLQAFIHEGWELTCHRLCYPAMLVVFHVQD